MGLGARRIVLGRAVVFAATFWRTNARARSFCVSHLVREDTLPSPRWRADDGRLLGTRYWLRRVHRFRHRSPWLALGHPLIDKEPPPTQPTRRDADAGDFIARVGADGDGHRQQMADDRLDAPAQGIVRQVQQLEADQDVVGQHANGVEGLVGQQFLAGRMVQIQAAEHFAKTLFLGPFELMPLKDRLRAVFVAGVTHAIRIAPE